MNEQVIQPKSWISFRVKPTEYEIINGLFAKSTCRNLSEYARKVLLQKPVTIRYRNESADEFLQQMLLLKKELNSIGNNYNQVVKKLHTLDHDPQIKRWLLDHDASYQKILHQTERMFLFVHQIHRKWLSA